MLLTAEVLAAAYEYLWHTEPFSLWNLPSSDEVKFLVVKTTKLFGYHLFDGKKHTIAISSKRCVRTLSLMETMAHEMIHLYQHNTKPKMARPGKHNKAFHQLGDHVCKIHGFDRGCF